ncbi:hypothetical protein OH77DRAFT_1232944 [Trametes cingulata]|nr:hypothetical protein OH77DRAFT_1232944 [Trametes cingulata]
MQLRYPLVCQLPKPFTLSVATRTDVFWLSLSFLLFFLLLGLSFSPSPLVSSALRPSSFLLPSGPGLGSDGLPCCPASRKRWCPVSADAIPHALRPSHAGRGLGPPPGPTLHSRVARLPFRRRGVGSRWLQPLGTARRGLNRPPF